MKRYGVMLDCSRNAVMKVSEVKHFINCIHKMGYNSLQLYTEDTYELKDEPYFGYMRGRYTAEEIKEIDAYANSLGIELIPCIQTLAHFHGIVNHKVYKDIVDVADILLIDEPKTYELIEKMFAFAAENFSSRSINIGMDEAHLMGRGKFIDKFGYQNRFESFTRHLNRVVDIAKKYGFTPHIWSDMVFRIANNGDPYGKNITVPQEVVDKFPKEVEFAYWDYYHYNKEDYDHMFISHKKMQHPVWFFGSAWTCCGFVPMWDKVLDTMKPAIESAIEHNVQNLFITAWGDGGKECSFFAALPLLYALRQYMDGNFDEKKIKEEFNQLFGVDFQDFELFSKVNGTKGREEYISSMHLYNDCLLGLNDCYVEENGAVDYKTYALKFKEAASRSGEFNYIFDCISSLCSTLELKYDFGVRLRKAYLDKNIEMLKQLSNECIIIAERAQDFYQKLKYLWYKENKPFGFEIQTMRLSHVVQRMKDCKERIDDFLSGKITSIEELEQKPLPHPEYDTSYNSLFSAGRIQG